MTALVPVPSAGEVVETGDYLDALSSRVRSEYRRSREAMGKAVDAYFAIGQCLTEAREALPSNQAFGEWLRAQDFGFSRQWAHVLQQAAEYEGPVRELLSTQVDNGGNANIKKAVKQVVAAIGGGRNQRPALRPAPEASELEPGQEAEPTLFPTIVIDPPWQYDNKATRGAATDHYSTMSLDELEELEIPAAANAHIYLWVTNGFLRQGFDLLDVWGFTYKACLTWCKPQMGMGNYFRNATEHVLFGIKGSLPTNSNDVPTWFRADRTRHSAKPESFMDIVERSSPGPYLEMFARRRRMGWSTWGNES
jgi:N6-adenosine-specific RNA methylase IME4